MNVMSTSLARDNTDDEQLAAKYACRGPRYTSYPTAPQFSDSFPLQQYLQAQKNQTQPNREPLSLYVHVPFCNDICYYCACNKVVTREPEVARKYLDRLRLEVEMQSALIGKDRPITQMHWGGGTPTYLSDAELTELMHHLASHFNLSDKDYREYSVEIDPRTVKDSSIALLKGLGFNRISLGVQDFDPLVQKTINRIQPYQQVAELVALIRRYNFRSLSFDLIYGLPHQDRTTMEETLGKVVTLRPDRVSCYNYAHLPERFSSQRSMDRLTLPSPEEKISMQVMITNYFKDAGYVHIGMDHYVLPDDELALAQAEGRLQRNFQGYSLRMADDLLGLGVSAISQVGDYYLQNERTLPEYYQQLDQGSLPIARGFQISEEDKLRRHIIMSLISELELDLTECNRRFDIDFELRFSGELNQLKQLEQDGLLTLQPGRIAITERGRPFLRNICMPFDAYLGNVNGKGPSPGFSATI